MHLVSEHIIQIHAIEPAVFDNRQTHGGTPLKSLGFFQTPLTFFKIYFYILIREQYAK
ncbi:hypothetical protein N406_02495 [Helicobacter pylori FD577]|nr:hypothetical protein N406_02495 [Helicobacter pylori FD577]